MFRYLFFWATAFFFSVSFALESGKPIPVDGLGQMGSGGLKNYVLGSYTSAEGKTRIFAFSSGCRQNKNLLSLYETAGENPDGTPFFKKLSPISYPSKNASNKDINLDSLSFVLSASDGDIYGFFRDGNLLLRTKFDKKNSSFKEFAPPLKTGPVSGIIENADASFYIYTRANTFLKQAEKEGLAAWNPKKEYHPFDGRLIWRGAEVRQYLNLRSLENINAESLSKPVKASRSDKDAILLLRGGSYASRDGKRHMFVGTREGLILHYKVADDGSLSEARPCIEGDVVLRAPNINNAPAVVLRDGNPDLITGGEGGLFYYKFKKFSPEGIPVYQKRVPARQTDTNLYFGSLPVVDAFDLDGDGLTDIIAGNSDGGIAWAKNIGESGNPKFAEPKLLKKLGEDFVEKGGYWNLQGPVEAIYGYTAPTVFDWNGDGKPDLLTGDNSSRFGVYFNLGNNNFSERKLLYCDGVELHGTWRQRPAVARLKDGKVAYAMFDWDDELRLYRRLDDLNLIDCGKLLLVDGKTISATGVRNAESGRVKLSFADIDNDGKTDLLMGTIGCNSVPDFKRGIPRNLKDSSKRGAAVLWLRNVGSDDKPVFEYPKLMTVKQADASYEMPNLGWHSCSADLADFGGNLHGILVGMEDGNILFWKFTDIKWLDFDECAINL